MNRPTVIIVDDDPAIRDTLELLVACLDCHCLSFPSADALLAHPLPDAPCCAIVDVQMPRTNGFELQAALNAQDANLPFVFISGERSIARVVYAIRAGAVDFLEKPFDPDHLLASVNGALNASIVGRHAARPCWLDAFVTAELTPRQQCILQLLIYGTTVSKIASILDISPDIAMSQYENSIAALQSHASTADMTVWLGTRWTAIAESIAT